MRRARMRTVSLLMLALLLATTTVASAAGSNPGVMPPNSRVQKLTYSDWTIKWWQYLFSLPASENPLIGLDTCPYKMVGNVALVVTYYAAGKPIECQVSPGTMLMVELLTSECSTLEPPPFNGTTPEELTACAHQFTPQHTQASIDGVPLQNLDQYLLTTPPYNFVVPAGNILGAPAGTTGQSVAYGELLLVKPLSVGEHTIHLYADMPSFNFAADRTLHVTVKR